MLSYTTRNGTVIRGKDEAARLFEALDALESNNVAAEDGLAWLVAEGYAPADQPDTHDDLLILLDDGSDVAWNHEDGYWEPGGFIRYI